MSFQQKAATAATSKLFSPLVLGRIGTLQHRVVLAPLTRNRASEPTLAPSPLAVQYYRQRSSPGGLLITEATNISPESLAYPSTPGIWNQTHVDGWKKVTDAVHEQGGYIVCQLWHTGRVAHPSFGNHPAAQEYYSGKQEANISSGPSVSASPTPIVNRHGKRGKTITYDGIQEHATPRQLQATDILRLCQEYVTAAQNAEKAGFDGVELHAAHGYLIDQFLNDSVNQRTDEYGGSPENRCRLLKEVLDSVLQVWPHDKVGVRLSPHDSPNGGNTYYGAKDSNPDSVYHCAVKLLNDDYNLAYLLLTEPRWVGKHDDTPETDPGFQMPLLNLQKYRSVYQGILMGAGGFTPTTSYSTMSSPSPSYDLLAFGRWFISNPDLPLRLQEWHAHLKAGHTTSGGRLPPCQLNRYDRDTFYTNDADGYIDYPSLDYHLESNKKQHAGMQLGKYPLVTQGDVGTSLKSTTEEQEQPRSKL